MAVIIWLSLGCHLQAVVIWPSSFSGHCCQPIGHSPQVIIVRPSWSGHLRHHQASKAVFRPSSFSCCCPAVVLRLSLSGRREQVIVRPYLSGCCHQASKAAIRPSSSGHRCQAVVVRPYISIAEFHVFNSKIVITIVPSMTSVSSESYYLTALIILPNKRCPKHTNEQRFKQRKSTLTQSYDVLSTYLDNTYLIVNSDSVGRVVCCVCGTWLIFTRFM